MTQADLERQRQGQAGGGPSGPVPTQITAGITPQQRQENQKALAESRNAVRDNARQMPQAVAEHKTQSREALREHKEQMPQALREYREQMAEGRRASGQAVQEHRRQMPGAVQRFRKASAEDLRRHKRQLPVAVREFQGRVREGRMANRRALEQHKRKLPGALAAFKTASQKALQDHIQAMPEALKEHKEALGKAVEEHRAKLQDAIEEGREAVTENRRELPEAVRRRRSGEESPMWMTREEAGKEAESEREQVKEPVEPVGEVDQMGTDTALKGMAADEADKALRPGAEAARSGGRVTMFRTGGQRFGLGARVVRRDDSRGDMRRHLAAVRRGGVTA